MDALMKFDESMKDPFSVEKLNMFFAVLTRFNQNEPLRKDLHDEIEQYFHKYWCDDKFLAIKTDEEIMLLEQLPI